MFGRRKSRRTPGRRAMDACRHGPGRRQGGWPPWPFRHKQVFWSGARPAGQSWCRPTRSTRSWHGSSHRDPCLGWALTRVHGSLSRTGAARRRPERPASVPNSSPISHEPKATHRKAVVIEGRTHRRPYSSKAVLIEGRTHRGSYQWRGVLMERRTNRVLKGTISVVGPTRRRVSTESSHTAGSNK